MNSKNFCKVRMILALSIALLSFCFSTSSSQSTSTGGTGSEVVGVVKYPDSSASTEKVQANSLLNTPLANCNVFIHPANYLAEYGTEDKPETVTEQDGFFRISNVRPGRHFVYVKDSKGNGVLREITVPDDSITIDLGFLLAQKTAGAQIQYSGTAPGDVLFYVSVRGTGLTIQCTSRGNYANLTGIPVGDDVSYMFTVRMDKPFSAGYDIHDITLQPGVITVLNDITDNLLNR